MLSEISQNSQDNTCARYYFFRKSLWHRCSPVNFAKFIRTTFLQNTSRRLLLTFASWHQKKAWSFYDLIRLISCYFALFMALKTKDEKFLWLDKTFVSFYFSSFMTFKTKMGSFCVLIRHLFLVLLLCSWLKKLKRQGPMT